MLILDSSKAAIVGRRTFLRAAGGTTLSAAAVSVLAGAGTLAGASQSSAQAASDVDILNVALGLEHEAIAAYQVGAESGLLQKAAMDVAVLFQSHHKAHRDALISTIGSMGGSPVKAKSNADYAAALNAGSLKSQADVLMLAAKLEKGAVNAYLGVIPAFKDGKLAQVAGRLAADETMHWSALAGVLGMALPQPALSFGA